MPLGTDKYPFSDSGVVSTTVADMNMAYGSELPCFPAQQLMVENG